MYKKLFAILIVLSFLLCSYAAIGANVALGAVTVGVKKGDWIEYRTVITGTPVPEHNVSRAWITILDVQGSNIQVNFTSEMKNGTIQTVIRTLNPEEGEIGSWFLIPANLDVGDTFYDKHAPEGFNTTIQTVTEMTWAGATRAISYCPSYFEQFKRWDKATGIFVEGLGMYENYSLNTIADKTNMWSPQVIGLDTNALYAVVAIVVIAVVALVIIFVARRKK
jgi:hypothetical protein